MDDRTIADDSVLVEHRAGEDCHVLANAAAGHDVYTGMNRRAVADRHFIADGREGMDIDVRTEHCGRADCR